MSEYLRLQFKRLTRIVKEWGMHPLILLTLIAIASLLLWKACSMDRRFIYGLAAASVFLPRYLSSPDRIQFLKLHFDGSRLRWIRAVESLVVSGLPLIILLLRGEFLIALSCAAIVLLMSFLPSRASSSWVTPTPFSRWPFEFTRGFRKTWWIYLLAIFILVMAIQVGNENLGLFAVAIPFLIALSFYIEPEDEFFVWVHSDSPRQFLYKKGKIASLYTLAMGLPLALAYGFFFPESLYLSIGLLLAGLVWVMTSLLAKYAHFPSELNLLQGIAVTFTIIFPPLGLIMIPVLFQKANKNLQAYLV